MQPLLYSEINFFCVLILLLMLYKIRSTADDGMDKRLLTLVLVSNIAFFLLDLAWIHVDNSFLQISVTLNWLINILYFIVSGVGPFFWLLYSEYFLRPQESFSRKMCVWALIPLLLLVVLAVSSPMTELLFYIDGANHYHRGTFYFIQPVISFGYLFYSAGRALTYARREENYNAKKKYFTLASFILAPVFFGLLQVFVPGLPLICVGITLAVLYVYIDLQEQRISLDPLTQLNNRHQFIRYLSTKPLYSEAGRAVTYILAMDVDGFKRINDQYGHPEGDRALIRIADALREACSGYNCFICRYGGDEFVAVCDAAHESDILKLTAGIGAALDRANAEAGVKYPLAVSVGYAAFGENCSTAQELFARADEELYRVKAGKRLS